MKVFIRADASLQIGTGHIGRDLALAEGFKSRGHEVTFLCRALQGNLISVLSDKGWRVVPLPPGNDKLDQPALAHSHWLESTQEEDAFWVREVLSKERTPPMMLVDHYGIDESWEKVIKPLASRLVVVDDLADRRHLCDVLIDHNFHEHFEKRYESLVPGECVRLLGPRYALLRSEFENMRKTSTRERRHLKKLLVFMGGIDRTGETPRVLRALDKFNGFEMVTVVTGSNSPYRVEVESYCRNHPRITCLVDVTNMAELMMENDLMISSGGSITWERCCMGLPAIVLSVAENQYETSQVMAQHGYQIHLGRARDVSENRIESAVREALDDEAGTLAMGRKCRELVDGQGIQRILTSIFG